MVGRRGTRLNPNAAVTKAPSSAAPRRVRWLLDGTFRRHLDNYHALFGLLQERLAPQNIVISWETCRPARFREIARQPSGSNELFLLASVPPVYQRLFAASGKPTLILGEAAPGVSLQYINADLVGIVRHATFRLLREGRSHLEMVHVKSAAAGIRSAEMAFEAACAGWSRAAVTHRIIETTLDQASLEATMQRLVGNLKRRSGIIVLAPVPIGMVVTALLRRSIAVPEQCEPIALMHSEEAVQLCPPPVHYPWPVAALSRQICAATERYFTTGTLPAVSKTVSIEATG